MQAIARLFNSLFGRRNDEKPVVRPVISQPRAASNRRRGVLVQGVEWQDDCLVLSYFRLNQLEKLFIDQDHSSIAAVNRATVNRIWDLEKQLIGKRVDLTFHGDRAAIHLPSANSEVSDRQVAAFAPRMRRAVAGRIDAVNVSQRNVAGKDRPVRALAVIIDQQMYWVNIEASQLPVLKAADLNREDDRYMLNRVLSEKYVVGLITGAKPDEFGFRTITLHRWSDANACRKLAAAAKQFATGN